MDIKEDLVLWFTDFCDKSSKGGGGVNIPLEFNEQLAKELRKPIIKKEQFIQDLKIIFGVLI